MRRAILAGTIGGVALLTAGWVERRELAGDLIDRRLAEAGVPGSYRIAALGPTMQVIEDVRLGDPHRPDLTARRIVLHWRYRLGLPRLAAVEIDGARLSGAWQNGRLSLGAIDRLLPSTGNGVALPDIGATLHDTRIALATPVGKIVTSIEGSGNIARDFRGSIDADAPRLAIAGCAAGPLTARLDMRTSGGSPWLHGPIEIGGASCGALRLGAGGTAVDLRLSRTLDAVDGRIALAGFAGHSGAARFGAVRGTIGIVGGAELAGAIAVRVNEVRVSSMRARSASVRGHYAHTAKRTTFEGRLALEMLRAAPSIPARIGEAARGMLGTPLGPLAVRLGGALATMATSSDMDMPISLAIGDRRDLRIDGATIRTRGGEAATFNANFAVSSGAWQGKGEIAGAGLPHVVITGSRRDPEGPIDATLRLAPYHAGAATLALFPTRVIIDNQGARFATSVILDGPLGSGTIEGLAVPLAGSIDRAGGLTLGGGCNTIAFRRIRLAAMSLDPARATLCGAPIVSKPSAGPLRIGATARDIVLAGHSGGAPLAIHVASLRFTDAGFDGAGIAASIGPSDDPTRFNIASLNGARTAQGISGQFNDVAGSIGHVPLALSGATGAWALAEGKLRLIGGLRVADRAPSPRFLPLASTDVTLELAGGTIIASGGLQAPGTKATIARVTLHHDLARGQGGAVLDVPGITFARKGLQPEVLTPLTLGVVANVAGTIHGAGRIDWTSGGTTSSGTFSTDRIDLAAAFGPVTGIAGTIRFTDLLGLVTAPHQEACIAEINPGIAVANGLAHYQLIGSNRVHVEDARWPFAGGTLALDPATLDFAQTAERRLTFRVAGLDAGAFIQQLDFPNISATGTFDGRLPMVFDDKGGRIEDGALTARGPGTLAYVGELSNAQLGTMGKLAFDALKAIRYSGLDIALDGSLDGEIVTRVRFDGVHQATGDKGLVARMIHNLPFRFNIRIKAPFRGLVGSARSYANPALLLQAVKPPAPVQPTESALVR